MIFSPSLIWFFVGVVFLIGELITSGFILIFFTAGCWVTGLFTWLFDIELTSQMLIFIVSSLALLFMLRRYALNTFTGATTDNIDDDYTNSKIGKKAIVTKTITPDRPGEIQAMGSFWMAVADTEITEGQSVVIESQSEDHLTFKVKPV